MSTIDTELLEELLTFNNEINCVKDTIGTVQDTKLLLMSNVENGSSEKELVEPFEHLFRLAKKPHTDIDYVKQKRSGIEMNIGENCNDVNVYDTDAFLRALLPEQNSLIELIEEQCNINPEFLSLVQHLHLLNKPCERNICSGKLIASTKFFSSKVHEVEFPIAHPPFVYELERILKKKKNNVKSYLKHLKRYLTTPIENTSCILCLTYDFYCLDISSMKNFRLLFLENVHPLSKDMMPIEFLYETEIENYNKNDQCFLLDKLISDIELLYLEEEEEEDDSDEGNQDKRFILRFTGSKRPKLYF